jgi:hypothetical protein
MSVRERTQPALRIDNGNRNRDFEDASAARRRLRPGMNAGVLFQAPDYTRGYSNRSSVAGSDRDARRAGNPQASAATIVSVEITSR